MKRDRNGDDVAKGSSSSGGAPALDSEHPAVAFHREVLIVQQWARIRQAFLAALQDTARHGVTWKEPKKLWRHSQEALGKWILSQIARVRGSGSGGGMDPYMARELHFFPTAADFGKFAPDGKAYDEQLIRDLSIKSVGGETDPAVAARLQQLVRAFDLAARSDAAHRAVEEQLAAQYATMPERRSLPQPQLRRLEEDDPTRTPSQRRVRGPLAEISVRWPAHYQRPQTRGCPPVSIPWPAYQKLRRSYEFFNSRERQPSPHADEAAADSSPLALTAEERFLYRAAVVALRYEGGLATGSLQLCADTALKQHLHAAGYHVMDLCASPINAYMGTPARSRFLAHETAPTEQAGGEAARLSSLEHEQESPNMFCSAFLDTDRYFGSLGSALRVDPLALHKSAYVNPAGRPLLLTLDVPYDEDLCEMLFQKLIRDMARAAAEPAGAVAVDYVLVLPLWWNIPMRIEKQLFSDATRVDGATPATALTAEERAGRAALVRQVVEERSAMLKRGYQVPYHWPEDLAKAAGDARAAEPQQQQQPWVCYDGLFVGNSGYAYFCTATNKWLEGVTATEVIGLAQPRAGAEGGGLLEKSLKEYYDA